MGPVNKNNKYRNKKKDRKNTHHYNQNENLSDEKPEHYSEDVCEGQTDDDSELMTSNSSNFEKRHHNDIDSDNELDTPRKKKKKQHIPADTPEKGKKSIRQIKREKFAQRQAEAQAVAKDNLKSQCLNYLSQWKHDKQNWKFMKAKQVWLYKNKFSTNLVPSPSWPLLLEYFESAQGNIRKMLLDDAKKIIKQMDEWTEFQTLEQANKNNDEHNNVSDEGSQIKKPDDYVYKRARDLIQCLEE